MSEWIGTVIFRGSSCAVELMSSSTKALCLFVTFCPQGMVTFSDPKEMRQALMEMDHHMVSSEMTAPEGGLASLVQHVLRVKLTEVGTLQYQHLPLSVVK